MSPLMKASRSKGTIQTITTEYDIPEKLSQTEETKDELFYTTVEDDGADDGFGKKKKRSSLRLDFDCPWFLSCCTSCPNGSWGSILLAQMTVLLFFNFASFSILATFFPTVALARGASRTEIGLIFGAYPAIAFPASLVYGALIPLVGTEKLLLAGIFTNGITVILFGFVPMAATPHLFVITCFLLRVLAAIGGAACETTVRAIVLTEFGDNIGFAMGLLSTSTQLGFTVGPFLGGILYSLGGFMFPFAVIGGLLLLLLFMVFFTLPKREAKPQQIEAGPLLKACALPGIILMGIALVVNVTGLAFLDPTLAPHVYKIKPDLPAAVAGLIFLLCGLSAAALSPFVGWFCDKKGHFIELVIAGLLLCGASLYMLVPSPPLDRFLPTSIWLVCLAVILNGASSAFVIAPAVSVMSIQVLDAGMPDDIVTNGAISGIVTAALNLGSFLGAFGGGVLNDLLRYSLAALVVGCFEFIQAAFIGCYAFFLKTRDAKKPEEEDYVTVREEQEAFHP